MPVPANKSIKCRHDSPVACGDCRLNELCLPLSLHDEELAKINEIIQRGRPLQKGEHLFRANDAFRSIYAVRTGTIKAYSITDDGKEQVTGFFLPGELLGMDGIGSNRYASSAKALETSSVCEIPFEDLENLSQKIPSLQRHFFSLMSKEIANDQQLITLLSKNTAEQRIASLILSISTRNSRRRLSAQSIRLPMSRGDIGNYLGLTVETVSRIFTRFQKQGLLSVDNKEIQILDIESLRSTASGVPIEELEKKEAES